jgi:hypothetical protein
MHFTIEVWYKLQPLFDFESVNVPFLFFSQAHPIKNKSQKMRILLTYGLIHHSPAIDIFEFGVSSVLKQKVYDFELLGVSLSQFGS